MDQPERTYRDRYAPPPFLAPRVHLEFDIDATRTIVTGKLELVTNPAHADGRPTIALDGHDLEILEVAVDGRILSEGEYHYDGKRLSLPGVSLPVAVRTRVAVPVESNSSMIGLSLSKDGDLFSQCEAEGMRRFTFMLDRPDVLAEYEVTLRADTARFPVLLSNGHCIATGELPGGRHWARWHDPIPKPSFIFCIVAGRLSRIATTHETASGRLVEVGLYAPEQHLEGCRPALGFVLQAMRWDEAVFGVEYDLSVFNICVLNGFLGAMENKGLNLFDLAWAVADPANTTDDEYEYRLKSVGHEYFHNWSGDRVTIANWFQTSLKEGLTRFRDQLFLSDLTEFSAVRIRMAQHIRNNQFTEDSSGVAHPPILDSYIDTRNNYSVTVYDKGQEIIFMLYNIVGRPAFEKITGAYFKRYATQAVTIEEFLGCFEEMAGLDLKQFRRWYYQSGLTTVSATGRYDADARRYTLSLAQRTFPTPDKPLKDPQHIPIAVGLVARSGEAISARLADAPLSPDGAVLELKTLAQDFVFEDVASAPVLSILRGFSAPVALETNQSEEDLATLLRYDADPFGRWDAGQRYVTRIVTAFAEARREGRAYTVPSQLTSCFADVIERCDVSPRVLAELLNLPDERALGEEGSFIDVDGVHLGREAVLDAIAAEASDALWRLVDIHGALDEASRDNHVVGRRKLKMRALEYLARLPDGRARDVCLEIVRTGRNFTEQVAALSILVELGGLPRTEALAMFADRHKSDQLAIDQWYRAQITAKRADTAATVEALLDAPDFDPVFSRMFAFCDQFFYRNRYGLHAPNSGGYDVFLRQMVKLDARVPMLAGWTLQRSDFTRWWKFDEQRRAAMAEVLETMLATNGLGEGCFEVCSNALHAGREALGSAR